MNTDYLLGEGNGRGGAVPAPTATPKRPPLRGPMVRRAVRRGYRRLRWFDLRAVGPENPVGCTRLG